MCVCVYMCTCTPAADTDIFFLQFIFETGLSLNLELTNQKGGIWTPGVCLETALPTPPVIFQMLFLLIFSLYAFGQGWSCVDLGMDSGLYNASFP
jgi:hypothetical protein